MDPSRDKNDHTRILRQRMVETQIQARGIDDQRVLEAMIQLPRDQFLPENRRARAYEDQALPVDHGQTISQPYIVAFMTEQLRLTPHVRTLEVGTGTGYQTALLAMLCRHVCSVERIDTLRDRASTILRKMNLSNISLHRGDGSLGLADHAPFDRILVTAAAPAIPGPLVDQLSDPGILVIPVGDEKKQSIVRVNKTAGQTRESSILACRFVKLIGAHAWPSSTGLARPNPES